ncbi:unnamed protein product [Ectocarpus sp. CCAP 1310/34]|nr:unnamed protein product [Ectocarpus sp. CCAP 1310/34]
MPATESLLLDKNPLLTAALELFSSGIGDGLTMKEVVRQLQTVALCYTAMGVKRNAGEIDSKKREALLLKAYKDDVVPGFLKWLSEEGDCTTPPWLTMEMMGRVAVHTCRHQWHRNAGAEEQGERETAATESLYEEPKLYKDGKKIWARYLDAFRDIRKDANPVYDKTIGDQPGGTPPSGEQYADQLDELLQALWEYQCREKNKTVEVTAEEKEFLRARGPSAAKGKGTGSGSSAVDVDLSSTDGEVVQGTEKEGGGADAGKDEEVAAGAGRAAGSEGIDGSGDGGAGREGQPMEQEQPKTPGEEDDGGSEPESVVQYPERPPNWLPYYFLTFCFFGRPSNSEDTDLAMKAGSGPSGDSRPRKKNKASLGSSSDGGSGSEGGASDPAANLGRAGVKQFVGAGEAQSRAQVKKAMAKDAAQQSAETIRREGLELAKQQAEISRSVAKAVAQVAADVQRGRELSEQEAGRKRKLEEEEACRKRKAQAKDDLKGELDRLDPDDEDNTARRAQIKRDLAKLYRTPVSKFTADAATSNPTSTPAVAPANASGLPATSSGVASPVAVTAVSETPAAAAAAMTTASPALSGFPGAPALPGFPGASGGVVGAVPSAGSGDGGGGGGYSPGWINITSI